MTSWRPVAGELDAAVAAGLSVEWNDRDAGLPYSVAGAVWLRDQIEFQPVQYMRGLAQVFVNAGGRLFESSRVWSASSGNIAASGRALIVVTAACAVISSPPCSATPAVRPLRTRIF
jgi:glycine/D-amino acid oxidase-like deaminating enzyme